MRLLSRILIFAIVWVGCGTSAVAPDVLNRDRHGTLAEHKLSLEERFGELCKAGFELVERFGTHRYHDFEVWEPVSAGP